jgi:hypothetical protein
VEVMGTGVVVVVVVVVVVMVVIGSSPEKDCNTFLLKVSVCVYG